MAATARLKQLVNVQLNESYDSTSNGMLASRAAAASLARGAGSSGIAASLANRSGGTADVARQSRGAVEGEMIRKLVQGDFSKSSERGFPVSAAKVWELEAGLASESSAVRPGSHREPRAEKTLSEEDRRWRNFFDKKVKVSNDWLRVTLAGASLQDAQLLLLADYLDERLQSNKVAEDESHSLWCHLELDQNEFGDEGIVAVLDVLEAHHVSCRMIKLYKNNLTDAGGIRLAEMLLRQTYAAQEIHLSHNGFTARTLIAMCMAMELSEAYPLLSDNQMYSPCWVRIERNCIANPLEVVDLLEKEGRVHTCLAKNKASCKPGRCERASTRWQSTPSMHLYMLQKQGDKGVIVDEDSHSELRAEIQRWRARAISQDPLQSFTSSGGSRGSAPSRRAVEKESSPPPSKRESQTQMGKDELLRWSSVVKKFEDEIPEEIDISARNPEELDMSSSAEPTEQERAFVENDNFSRLWAQAAQNDSWKRDQEEARRRQVETALEIVTACLPPEDPEVFSRWRTHIEMAAEPELEANRIFRMMTKLHSLGYMGGGAQSAVRSGSRSSSPFAHSNASPREFASATYAYAGETVGSLAKRFNTAAGGFSHFSNGNFSTTPPLSGSSSPPPRDGLIPLNSGGETDVGEIDLQRLLSKLQQSTTPSNAIGPSVAVALDETRIEGETEKKKKGKNKINASTARAEIGDSATEGFVSAPASQDMIPATTLSHTREGEYKEPESSWLDVQAVQSDDLLRRLVEDGKKSGTEEQS